MSSKPTTMAEVQAIYGKLCTALGDIQVRIQGLGNQRDEIFAQIDELEAVAAAINEKGAD